eukprot:1379589-Pleurochrysis_carterae.AAC.1
MTWNPTLRAPPPHPSSATSEPNQTGGTQHEDIFSDAHESVVGNAPASEQGVDDSNAEASAAEQDDGGAAADEERAAARRRGFYGASAYSSTK